MYRVYNTMFNTMIPKILIVDDDPDIVIMFKQAYKNELENQVFDFAFCFSTEEALNFLEISNEPRLILILSDINMPGRNGLELLREIKSKGTEIPVYLFTAFDDDNNRMVAERLKVDKYISKPIDFHQLKKDIFNLL